MQGYKQASDNKNIYDRSIEEKGGKPLITQQTFLVTLIYDASLDWKFPKLAYLYDDDSPSF